MIEFKTIKKDLLLEGSRTGVPQEETCAKVLKISSEITKAPTQFYAAEPHSRADDARQVEVPAKRGGRLTRWLKYLLNIWFLMYALDCSCALQFLSCAVWPGILADPTHSGDADDIKMAVLAYPCLSRASPSAALDEMKEDQESLASLEE